MRPSQIEELIKNAIKDPVHAPPLFIEGPPGVGKSAILKQITESAQIGWLDTRASQHDPTDFRGIPAVINNTAVWLPPADIPFVGNKAIPEKGIWVLDEVTSAPPLVQAVLYQAVLDHRIGEHVLKPEWYIVACGNRIEDRAVTYRMSSALANRFAHVQIEVNLDDWVEWAKKNKINPNIIMFLKYKSELLFAFNPESSEKAFCSPRTWAMASNHIALQTTKILPEILTGTVGKGATAEFMSFLKLQTELPDINTIFEGSNFVPKRLDLTYALVGALAQRAKGGKDFERMLKYSEHLDVEFGVLLITMLAQKDESAMATAPSFEKWALRNADIIRKVK